MGWGCGLWVVGVDWSRQRIGANNVKSKCEDRVTRIEIEQGCIFKQTGTSISLLTTHCM